MRGYRSVMGLLVILPTAGRAAPSQSSLQRDMTQRIAKATGEKVEPAKDGWPQVSINPGRPGKNLLLNFGRIWAGCQTLSAIDCAAQEHCIAPRIHWFRNGQWQIAEKT